MNKTIKEQAAYYYQMWGSPENDYDVLKFSEYIITEERKRRLPTKEEAMKKYKEFCDRDESGRLEDVADLYDWLLSCESEAVVEDEVKGEGNYGELFLKHSDALKTIAELQIINSRLLAVKEHTINRNELAEKIMFSIVRETTNTVPNVVGLCFRLADEFIKQAKS